MPSDNYTSHAASNAAFEADPLLAACYVGSIFGRQAFGPGAGQTIPRLGDSDRARRSTIHTPLCARNSGFSLHAAVRIPARERLRLERLVALVPRPGRPKLTYHGILAPAASLRDHVVPASPPSTLTRVRGLHAAQCLFGDSDLLTRFGAGDADAPAPARTLHLG